MKNLYMLLVIVAFVMPNFAFVQEVEPNDSPGTADRITGLTIYGNIAYPGDVDWFILQGQEGSNPSFFIYHDPSIDLDFEVYSGSSLVGRATGVNSGDGIACYVPGRCHVKVYSARGAGNYTININPGSSQQPQERVVYVDRPSGRCGATGCEFLVLFGLLLALKKYRRN